MAENFAEITRTVEFRMAVEMELAENRGLFRPLCGLTGSGPGKAIEITDRFSRLKMQVINERNGRTNNVDPDVTRRWIKKPKRSGVAPLLDPDDALATKVGLKSPLAMGVADAQRIYADDQMLSGFYGTAYTGEDGATAVPFKSANVLPADTGETPGTYTGLTLSKLRALRFLMRRRFARKSPTDMINMAITAYEINDLFKIDQYINGDYRGGQVNPQLKPLENGEAVDFLGIHFVPAEFDSPENYPVASTMAVNASGHRKCPVWLNSGMYFHSWLEFEGYDDRRPDLNHSEQLAGYSCLGAARVNEDKCFIVECNGTGT